MHAVPTEIVDTGTTDLPVSSQTADSDMTAQLVDARELIDNLQIALRTSRRIAPRLPAEGTPSSVSAGDRSEGQPIGTVGGDALHDVSRDATRGAELHAARVSVPK